jgi:hypothetical protein
MAVRRGGIGPRGRQSLQSRMEEIGDENSMMGSYLGAVTELGDVVQPTTIDNLPDLWPDKSNYYKGPFVSTRVHKHRFVFDEDGQTGTAYVQFKNLREKNGSVYERGTSGAVYAYYNMPYSDYKTFTISSSKGQEIDKWTRRGRGTYESLGKNNTVFDAVSPARFDPRKERFNPAAPFTPYTPTED